MEGETEETEAIQRIEKQMKKTFSESENETVEK